jgi:hypothetical protein
MNDPMKLLITDHREVRNLLHNLKRSDSLPAQTELLGSIGKLLKSHWVIEKELVYPLMNSTDLAPHAAEADAEHELQLGCLDQLTLLCGEPGFASVVVMLAGAFKHHAKHEERHLLPALKAALGDDEWETLGDRVLVAQSVVEAKGRVSAKVNAADAAAKKLGTPQKVRKPLTLPKAKLPKKSSLFAQALRTQRSRKRASVNRTAPESE